MTTLQAEVDTIQWIITSFKVTRTGVGSPRDQDADGSQGYHARRGCRAGIP